MAAEALAGQVTRENYENGMIYPPFSDIRKISTHIAANVAAKAYDLGELLVSRHPFNYLSDRFLVLNMFKWAILHQMCVLL